MAQDCRLPILNSFVIVSICLLNPDEHNCDVQGNLFPAELYADCSLQSLGYASCSLPCNAMLLASRVGNCCDLCNMLLSDGCCVGAGLLHDTLGQCLPANVALSGAWSPRGSIPVPRQLPAYQNVTGKFGSNPGDGQAGRRIFRWTAAPATCTAEHLPSGAN